MARAREHRIAGALSGTLLTLFYAAGRSQQEILLEAVGGCVFGMLGARLPDLIDPPTSPNHRGAAHSAGGALCSVKKVDAWIVAWQAALRAEAARQWALAERLSGSSDATGHQLAGTLLLIAAGALPGLVAGYASHLILDAATPKGIPVIA